MKSWKVFNLSNWKAELLYTGMGILPEEAGLEGTKFEIKLDIHIMFNRQSEIDVWNSYLKPDTM